MRMQEAYKAQHHWNLCRAALRYNHINVFLLCIFKSTQWLTTSRSCAAGAQEEAQQPWQQTSAMLLLGQIRADRCVYQRLIAVLLVGNPRMVDFQGTV